MTIVIGCRDSSHNPLVLDEVGSVPWTPARRVTPAHEYHCPICGRSARLGVRRMRALSEAASRGETGEVDISALA